MGRQKVEVTELEKSLIEVIEVILRERDWTERRLSIEAGMVQSTVHRMMSGHQNLTLSYLEKICVALRLRVSELVREAEINARSSLSIAPDILQGPDETALAAHTGEKETEQ